MRLRVLSGLIPIVLFALVQCAPVTTGNSTAYASGDAGTILNAIRADNNLSTLSPNAALRRAAAAHAHDLHKNNLFGHISSNGDKLRQRVWRQGYSYCHVSENVGKGQKSAAEIMRNWMESPSHRRNIMNPRSREYGIVRGPGDVWVLVMGQPGCRV